MSHLAKPSTFTLLAVILAIAVGTCTKTTDKDGTGTVDPEDTKQEVLCRHLEEFDEQPQTPTKTLAPPITATSSPAKPREEKSDDAQQSPQTEHKMEDSPPPYSPPPYSTMRPGNQIKSDEKLPTGRATDRPAWGKRRKTLTIGQVVEEQGNTRPSRVRRTRTGSGTVLDWDRLRGVGCISPDDGSPDVCVYFTQVLVTSGSNGQSNKHRPLTPKIGQQVDFTTGG